MLVLGPSLFLATLKSLIFLHTYRKYQMGPNTKRERAYDSLSTETSLSHCLICPIFRLILPQIEHRERLHKIHFDNAFFHFVKGLRPPMLQPRAYNKNKSGALLFLSPRCKFHHSAHSLLPCNAELEGIESVDCAVICILGSKIIVHQICSSYTLLAVDT